MVRFIASGFHTVKMLSCNHRQHQTLLLQLVVTTNFGVSMQQTIFKKSIFDNKKRMYPPPPHYLKCLSIPVPV